MTVVGSIDLLAHSTGPFLITFREALEATLIIAIIAAYLNKIGRPDLKRYLALGSVGAVALSVLLGIAINFTLGGLSGISEKLFGGLAAITATGVLTYMIFWMARNSRRIRSDLESKVNISITKGYFLGIVAVAFIAVLREGIETVLFLTALISIDVAATIIGGAAGVVAVLGLYVAILRGAYRLNIKAFFKYTSILLLIFAAGLFGFGVHELIEAGEELGISLGVLALPAFNINPVDIANPLHEMGALGSIMKSLVGYDGNPEWLRVVVYLGYWVTIGAYLLRTYVPHMNGSRMAIAKSVPDQGGRQIVDV